MKITNKKMFIRGFYYYCLPLVLEYQDFVYLPRATHGIPKAVIGIGICLLAAFITW